MFEPIGPLQTAIHSLHGCQSVWVESVEIVETFNDEVIWEGEVQVFDLPDCAAGSRCYAWSHAIEGSARRRFVAILCDPSVGVNSPHAAVQAAIIADQSRTLPSARRE